MPTHIDQQPLARRLLHALKEYGAAEIFGIPGDFALPFFKEIEASNILPLYTLSHEPGVGFAADGAARFRSNLSVAAITYGAGGLNMINAIAMAYSEKSPVVAISGAPGAGEGDGGLALHHQVKHLGSQLAIYREITIAQAVLDDPVTAPAEIARVLTAAKEFSRPVYIEFPRDQVVAPAGPVPAFQPTPSNPEAAAACAREALTRLREATRPALLLGVEVRRYGLEAKVAELAARLSIPTATSFMAQGVLSDAPEALIGGYLGLAGDDAVREAIEGADTLLMLGVILSDTNFGVSERNIDHRHAIHAFDREVRFAHHHYPQISLEALVDALLAELDQSQTNALGAVAPTKRAPPPTGLQRDDQPILPDDLARAVNDLFEARGKMPIAADIGDCLFTAMDIAQTALVAPAYYATMGPGVPMGLGVEAASGRRPLILVGDGAFQMTGWELGNATRLGLKPIVLMLNNSAWGMLKVFQPETSYNDLGDWRYAEMAAGMGGVGVRVSTRAELWDALIDAADDTENWRLIEAMVPRGNYSRTLTRFVEAVKRRSVLGQS
ncbi:MAG: indolepyruvate/phenylpyruvate decarboxylase [Neomegalonema sp.]|nr:indolepyruvate/phenylpyruvate decarboxylase [Neomegalonema sp.]